MGRGERRMSLSASGRTWEEASAPAAIRLARRFETAWRDAGGGVGIGADTGAGPGPEGKRASDQRLPDPDDFLPADAGACPGARLALLRADLSLRWEGGQRIRRGVVSRSIPRSRRRDAGGPHLRGVLSPRGAWRDARPLGILRAVSRPGRHAPSGPRHPRPGRFGPRPDRFAGRRRPRLDPSGG